MDRLEVFAFDGVPGHAVIFVQGHGQVADDVLDEFRIVERLFGDEFFIGSFEHGVNRGAGGGFHDGDEFFDPHHAVDADAGGDFAALVVGAVGGNFFGAGAEAGGGGADSHDEIVGAVAGSLEGADIVHQAFGAGDGGGFFDEIGEGEFDMGVAGVELGFHFLKDGDDLGGGDGRW